MRQSPRDAGRIGRIACLRGQRPGLWKSRMAHPDEQTSRAPNNPSSPRQTKTRKRFPTPFLLPVFWALPSPPHSARLSEAEISLGLTSPLESTELSDCETAGTRRKNARFRRMIGSSGTSRTFSGTLNRPEYWRSLKTRCKATQELGTLKFTFFGAFRIVSTTAVLLRLCASLTGINLPVPASLPTFPVPQFFAIVLSFKRNQSYQVDYI